MTGVVVAAALGLVVGLVGLGLAVRRLVAVVRRPPLARLPVVPQQDVAIAEAGAMLLQIEGPIGTTAFVGVDVTLDDVTHGRPIALRPIVFRARSSGFTRARLSWKRFALDAPATLRVRVDGLAAGRDVAACALVVARPAGVALPATILGVVASAILVVCGIVGLALVASGAV